jgi:2,4-dienoyl-CoA reductase-like NADH-dependent reductase (Old Yellow Enzyme family)
MVGRNFLRNPHWAIEVAEDLGQVIEWQSQYERARRVTESLDK